MTEPGPSAADGGTAPRGSPPAQSNASLTNGRAEVPQMPEQHLPDIAMDAVDQLRAPATPLSPPQRSTSEVSVTSARSAFRKQTRAVYLNIPLPRSMLDYKGRRIVQYASNRIVTAKYTRWSFIPKNLFEQFRRVANQYFLFLVILQLIPVFGVGYSPVGIMLPITFVVCVTAVKDGYEDWKRHILDNELNHTKTMVLRGPTWKNVNYPDGGKKERSWRAGLARLRYTFCPCLTKAPPKSRESLHPVEEQKQLRGWPAMPNEKLSPRDMPGSTLSTRAKAPKFTFVETFWEDVLVGDIVLVRRNHLVPADMVLFASSDQGGSCFVETKELDGETNLKLRRAHPDVAAGIKRMGLFRSSSSLRCRRPRQDVYRDAAAVARLYVESEPPSPNLFVHNATVTIVGREELGAGQTAMALPAAGQRSMDSTTKRDIPLNVDNLVLRGHVIRNTEWAIGLVLFTGPETKIVLNASKTPSKRSQTEIILNAQVMMACSVLFFLCLVATIAAQTNRAWEFSALSIPTPSTIGDWIADWVVSFFSTLIMFQSLVPISLYVSIEFVKTLQAYFIWSDVKMYDSRTDRTCKPKSWNLSDDLGQVEYIFSDKTGTLTRNMMEFRRCVVGNVTYGEPIVDPLEGAKSSHAAEGPEHAKRPEELEGDSSTGAFGVAEWRKCAKLLGPYALQFAQPPEKMTFRDPRVLEALAEAEYEGQQEAVSRQANDVRDFFALLAVCHTAVIEEPEEDESDDDEAIVAEGDESGKDGATKGEVPTSKKPPENPPTDEAPATTVPRGSAEAHAIPRYKAESPDENALVAAARDVGFAFLGEAKADESRSSSANRRRSSLSVSSAAGPTKKFIDISVPSGNAQLRFEIIAVIQFDSTRKRMSVVVRRPKPWNDTALLLKGADAIVLDLLKKDQGKGRDHVVQAVMNSVDEFAGEGLRTLMLAWRPLDREILEEFLTAYKKACAAIHDRDKMIALAAGIVEKDMLLLGATGIEDRLGEGVPKAIRLLREAGIKLWVLTGDKMETAINIGYSCRLLEPETQVYRVSAAGGKRACLQAFRDLKARLSAEGAVTDYPPRESAPKSLAGKIRWSLRPSRIFFVCCGPREFLERRRKPVKLATHGNDRALVIEGQGLKHILDDPACRQDFLSLTTSCSSVVCCRVSPLQKAQVVELVRHGTGTLCLAVGDGANDVSMIQAANVGVGISGEEGVQAAMAADYAIAQFRHLAPLLLVHGTWSYARVSEMILNFFYKNVVFSLVPFWFMFVSQFSASLFYDYSYIMLYNVCFTLTHVLVVGCFDQAVSRSSCLKFPQLYLMGINQSRFSMPHYWLYEFEGIIQSMFIFFLGTQTYASGPPSSFSDDRQIQPTGSLNELSSACAILVVMVVNVYNGLNTYYWTWMAQLSVWGSILTVFAFTIIYGEFQDSPLAGTAVALFRSVDFWLFLGCGLVVCLLPRYTFLFAKRKLRPADDDIVREIQQLPKPRPNRREAAASERDEAGSGPAAGEFDEDRYFEVAQDAAAAAGDGKPPDGAAKSDPARPPEAKNPQPRHRASSGSERRVHPYLAMCFWHW